MSPTTSRFGFELFTAMLAMFCVANAPGISAAPRATATEAGSHAAGTTQAPYAPLSTRHAAPPRDPTSNWNETIREGLAAREYRPSRSALAASRAAGLQAPNRAQNFRTHFESSGIRVHDRMAEGSPSLLGLALVAIGRGERLSPVAPGDLTSDGTRVEIQRPNLVEWYVNSPSGLEHGFTLAGRPAGEQPLTFELGVKHALALLRDDHVVFEAATGRRLIYDKLIVLDADGNVVPARLEVPNETRVRIVVADGSATYPLTVDPLLSESSDSQLESDQAGATLGFSVSGAGDVNGDGYADVIVGAPYFDAGELNEGAAFIFHGGASGVADANSIAAVTQLESNQSDSEFGYSVSGAGDVNADGYADVIVGARYYSNSQFREGAAFVFHGSASGVADAHPATAATQIDSNQEFSYLGLSVSDAGDVNGDGYGDVIVGAPLYNSGLAEEGAAFVFHGSASGIAGGDPTNAATQLESNQDNAEFGFSVSGAGDVNGDGFSDVIVGAPIYEIGFVNAGGAFVFLGSASGIPDADVSTAATRITSPVGVSGRIGYSVSDAGDVNGDGYADVLVGSSFTLADGVAYLFLGSASGIPDSTPATAAAEFTPAQSFAELGWSVSGAGDVNGDGYGDVIIGARWYDAGESDEGAGFVFLGSSLGLADGTPATADAQLESDQAGAFLGERVAHAGDVNGDGFSDVIVGAPRYEADLFREGAAFIYEGSSDVGLPAVVRQRRANGSGGPVARGGAVFASDRFVVDLHADVEAGMQRVRIEVEVCEVGLPFGDPACGSQMSATWVDLGASGAALSLTFTGLAADTLFSWRGRALYTPTTSGSPPTSKPGPWFRLQGQAAPGEIRTVPEPGTSTIWALGTTAMCVVVRRIATARALRRRTN